jgi:ligand-binding sensor domain-containing protein
LAGRFEEVEMKRYTGVSLGVSALLLLAVAASSSHAQGTEPGEFRTTLTNSNDCLAVTVVGDDVWVGTTGGLVHWNRVYGNYVKYLPEHGLAGLWVAAVEVDGAGNVWAGTSGGGASRRSAAGEWTTYSTSNGLANNYVYDVHTDQVGDVWFATDGGVSRLEPDENWTTYTTADGLAHSEVRDIEQDEGGALWFATHGGVSRLVGGSSWTTFTTTHGLAGNEVPAAASDGAGTMWFATAGGVSQYEVISDTWTTYTTTHGLPYSRIETIAVASNGDVWAGCRFGAAKFDGVSSWTSYGESDGLAGDLVKGISFDSGGDIWFATYEWGLDGGLTRFDGASSWAAYLAEDVVSGNGAWAVSAGEDGTLWLGYSTSTADRFGSGAWEASYEVPYQLGVTHILVDGIGAWLGTQADGLYRWMADDTWTHYTTGDGLGAPTTDNILEDAARGWLYVGHWGRHGGPGGWEQGVSRLDVISNTWTIFNTGNSGLLSDNVIAAAIEDDGTVWFGHYDGISRFDGGSNWMTYTVGSHPLAGAAARAVAVDGAGNRWFGHGYYSGPVSRFDGTTWITHTTIVSAIEARYTDMLDSQYEDDMLWVVDDVRDEVWTAEGDGVSVYDGSTWQTLTTADGLAHNSVYGLAVDLSGNVWFATAGGVSVLNWDGIHSQQTVTTTSMALDALTGDGGVAFGSSAFTDTVDLSLRALPATSSGALRALGHQLQVTAAYTGTADSATPTDAYTLTLQYREDELAGVSEASLAVYHWSGGSWLPEPTGMVYTTTNSAVALPGQLGLYGLFGRYENTVFLPLVLRNK